MKSQRQRKQNVGKKIENSQKAELNRRVYGDGKQKKIIYFKCEKAKAHKEVKQLTRGHLLKKAQVQDKTPSSFSSSFCGLFVSLAKLRPRENVLVEGKQWTVSEVKAQQVKSVELSRAVIAVTNSVGKVHSKGLLHNTLATDFPATSVLCHCFEE